jgi:hypothetical protein
LTTQAGKGKVVPVAKKKNAGHLARNQQPKRRHTMTQSALLLSCLPSNLINDIDKFFSPATLPELAKGDIVADDVPDLSDDDIVRNMYAPSDEDVQAVCSTIHAAKTTKQRRKAGGAD